MIFGGHLARMLVRPPKTSARAFSATKAGSALLLLAAPLLLGSASLTSSLEPRLLAAHNRERGVAGVESLSWSPALADDASAWAAELARRGAFEHSPDPHDGSEPQGENLWMGTADFYSAEAMVDFWIREKRAFKTGIYPHNSRTGDISDVGHYTQLMWRDTDRVGCGLARGRDYDVLVCRYSKAGNVRGERPF